MNLGIAFIAAGFAQFLAGWIWHRHPNQKFWVVAPIWRASEFLSPTGVSLWVGGQILMGVGVVSMLAQPM